MRAFTRHRAIAAALTALTVAVPGLLLVPTGVASPVSPVVSSQQWAYGGQASINASGFSANGQFTAHAFLGWHVILTQTNRSDGTFQVSAQRTLGAALYVSYCQPSCSSPQARANLSTRATEVDLSVANFSPNGFVSVNGAPVPATAIENSSASETANLTQSFQFTVNSLPTPHTGSGSFWLEARANASIQFSPALGLFPTSITPGESWSSVSDYVAVGSWSAFFTQQRTYANGSTSHVSEPIAGSASGAGNISLFGRALSPITLRGGLSAIAVALSVAGPFHPREGLIFIPETADLFGGSHQPWDGQLSGQPYAQTDVVDVEEHGASHVGLVAAATNYTGASTAPSTAVVTPAVAPADGTPAQLVQAQPETVPAAETGSQCVLSGCLNYGPNPPGGGGPGAGALLGPSVVGLVTAVAVIGLIALVASRRRPVRTPPSPNASLYPPGAAAPPPPSGVATVPGKNPPPGPTAPDPLDHLW